jgi:hypothetical protein
MPTQKNGKVYCDCGSLMRYRRRTNDYACTQCPKTVPLAQLTALEPVKKSPSGEHVTG